MPRPLNQTETDLNADNLLRLPAEFGCPVWVYDAQIVREKIAALHQFDVVRFAQKACSNIHILRLMHEQGVKVDSVSLGEIERALARRQHVGQRCGSHLNILGNRHGSARRGAAGCRRRSGQAPPRPHGCRAPAPRTRRRGRRRCVRR